MNSKVKQAQKEGASVADISSGLAYSVIKNALYKVIKLSDASELGQNIVVQGGTFYNDAVLRSFEQISGCTVIRPDIAGIMGAFGAALIAKERYAEHPHTTMLSMEEINALTFKTELKRCPLCLNHCLLTVNHFSGDRTYITGNRCERGLGEEKKKEELPNLFAYKNKRIFAYPPLPKDKATRGTVGLPRMLNMYENYPFWAVFFRELEFSVLLSPQSSRQIYELGIDSIPSESECYPAKLSHGHVSWLIEKQVDFIFYPGIPYERNEFPEANNHFNCPIVTSYSENIKNNVDAITSGKMRFLSPFLTFGSYDALAAVFILIQRNNSLLRHSPDQISIGIFSICFDGCFQQCFFTRMNCLCAALYADFCYGMLHNLNFHFFFRPASVGGFCQNDNCLFPHVKSRIFLIGNDAKLNPRIRCVRRIDFGF